MRYLILVMGLVFLGSETALGQLFPQGSPPPAAPTIAGGVSANPQATSASYGDWLLACQRSEGAAQKTCEVSQTIQVQGQPGPIAQFAVSKSVGSGPGMRLIIVLPANVTLSVPPKVSADDKDPQPVDAAWARCVPGACVAEMQLRDDVVRRWRALSSRGGISFKDAGGHDVAVPFSFRGFAQALDALSKES